MHQGVSLEQSVQLTLTPEVRQGIAVMAMTASDLREFLENKMDENPLIVFGGEGDGANPASQTAESGHREREHSARRLSALDEASYRSGFDASGWETDRFGAPASYELAAEANDPMDSFGDSRFTLEDAMEEQLMMELRNPADRAAAAALIDGLDGDGYLRFSLESLSEAHGVDERRLQRVQRVMLISCDPPGIGARSVGERLAAQLTASGKADRLSLAVVAKHLDDLASGRFASIAAALDTDAASIKAVYEKIRTLDPHPAHRFARNAPTVQPEVFIVEGELGYEACLDDGLVPDLAVDESAMDLALVQRSDKGTLKMLEALRSDADAVVRAVDLRKMTVLALSRYIAEEEADFFSEGIARLRPLTMAAAASAAGVSESTVSRVANGTFLSTPRGVLEMRYFFHSGVTAAHGEEVSSRTVQQTLKELVAAEDPAHPLSDARLAELLAQRGMDVSRRTVAKYRDIVGIPSSSKRKQYDS